jgi:ribosome maturation factor RimP
MAMDFDTPLRSLLSPLGLTLYDVELEKGSLNVVVNKEGGVDLESLTKANRTISEWLDANDPIPGRYTLDVSSPGLERRLRTKEHFVSAIGEVVTLRELRDTEPTRRLEGTLLSVDGSTLELNDQTQGRVVVYLSKVERARTVFAWGGEKKPSPSRATTASSTSKKG